MGRLDGRTALITGGTSGIGLAAARRFAGEGATVFITGRREAPPVPAAGPGDVVALRADVSDLAQVEEAVRRVVETTGRLDVVYANAGVRLQTPLESRTSEATDMIIATNLGGVVHTVQAAAPQMSDGGSIILGGSVASGTAEAGYALYGATKAAVRSLARTWALELRERSIRVNTISPGPTDTPMMRSSLGPAAFIAVSAWIVEHTPAGRVALPEDISDAALFLASDDSRFVNGIDLVVDGGLTQV